LIMADEIDCWISELEIDGIVIVKFDGVNCDDSGCTADKKKAAIGNRRAGSHFVWPRPTMTWIQEIHRRFVLVILNPYDAIWMSPRNNSSKKNID